MPNDPSTDPCLACAWERALMLPRGTYKDHVCEDGAPDA